jgi:DNA-binding MarR family transcriptional regulator
MSEKKEPFALEDFELARLLSVTRDAIRRGRQKELKKHKVHTRRVVLLQAIQSLKERATPVAIGEWLLRERHTVSELLSKMEKEGLLEKVRDLDRKNRVRVVLTSKGEEISCQSRQRESLHRTVAPLTEEDRKLLARSLKKLRDQAMKELGDRVAWPRVSDDDPDFQLFGLIVEAADAMRKARQRELNRHGIDMSWSAILLTVRALGDRATPVTIGKWLLRERHTVSELLSKMESEGLLEKIRDLERKNRVRVVLTPQGEGIYRKSQGGTVFQNIASSLTGTERQHLVRCLRLLKNEALKDLKGIDSV